MNVSSRSLTSNTTNSHINLPCSKSYSYRHTCHSQNNSAVNGICFALNNSTIQRNLDLNLHSNWHIFRLYASEHATQPWHVDCKQFEYASRHCAIWRRAVLAAMLPACTPTPRPTRPDKEWGNRRGILCTLEHCAECTTFVRHHYRVYRSYTCLLYTSPSPRD